MRNQIVIFLFCIFCSFVCFILIMPKFWIFGNNNMKETLSQATEVNKILEGQPGLNEIEEIVKECPKSIFNNACQVQTEKSPPLLYYGVSVPLNVELTVSDAERKVLVYTDKCDALKAVKKYKGARFKAFTKVADAVAFSSQPIDDNAIGAQEKILGTEKITEFHGPSRQEIVKLRKGIETGDSALFSSLVWSNPRYLISGVDTPTIMMEGYRYNALHVAAKHKQPELCKLIIDAIENEKFMELLYPDNSPEIRKERMHFIIDLYLNMPDKKLSETPLHFAAKFGCLKAVEILISHSACDKQRKNKYGLTAQNIICERCPASETKLKQQIEKAFEGKYFVPVLRSKDNIAQPVIGEPYSPEHSQIFNDSSVVSPHNPELSIMAVAGPMSPVEAKTLYKQWKTPPRFSKEGLQSCKIRLSDAEKGLERIGRDLARDMKTKWIEYWPSLDTWCDLSTADGLQALEKHLQLKYKSLHSVGAYSDKNTESGDEKKSSVPSDVSIVSESDSKLENTDSINLSSVSSESSEGISQLCRGLQGFHVTESVNTYTVNSASPVLQSKIRNRPLSKEITDAESEVFQNGSKKYDLKPSRLGNGNLPAKAPTESQDSQQLNDVKDSKSLIEVCKGDSEALEPCTLPKEKSKPVEENYYSDSQSKHCSNSKKSLGENQLVNKVLDVISYINSHSDSLFDNSNQIHLRLSEDVLPEIQCLLKLTKTKQRQELSQVYHSVAEQIYKEMECQFLNHEMETVCRYLVSYVDIHLPIHSLEEEDDEDDNEAKKSRAIVSQNYLEVPISWHKLKWQHLRCILKFLCDFIANSGQSSFICDWERKDVLKGVEHSASDSEKTEARSNKPLTKNGPDSNCRGSFSSLCSVSSDTEGSEEFVTPPGSPASRTSGSDDEDEPVTPNEGLEVYIEGSFPSKADTDIFRAIEKVFIDPVLYPHILRWKHLISLKDKKTLESWPSPAVKKYRQHRSIISNLSNSPSSPISPLALTDKTKASTPSSVPRQSQDEAKTATEPKKEISQKYLKQVQRSLYEDVFNDSL